MSEANEERGEMTITLEGVEYGLRPSWEAIKGIEARTGQRLRALAVAANRVDLSIEEMGIIAGAFMRAWGRLYPDAENARVAQAVRDDRLAELIFEAGVVEVAAKLTVLLVAALSGGMTASGELKAPAVKGTTTGA